MALVSNAPRAATVTAQGDVDILELSRLDLEGHAGELESVKMALRKFTRGRFLANLAATSPLFRDLEKMERRGLMRKFRPRKVQGGDILIEEGENGRGLFLVLRGEYAVSTKSSGKDVELARLGGGDVFGEIALLKDLPTNATVTACSIGEVLYLPKEEFLATMDAHPNVRITLASMSEARIKERAIVTGDRIITDDAQIMV